MYQIKQVGSEWAITDGSGTVILKLFPTLDDAKHYFDYITH
jgi:hypothetical protein